MSTAARRREQRHLGLSTAGRGCKRRRCLRIVNANEMPVLTRENVLESTLYFLQHRWRLWDYVRTPAGSLTWGVAARTHEEWPILSAVAPASMSASEVMGLRSNSSRGSVGAGQIVQPHPLLDSGRAESVRPEGIAVENDLDPELPVTTIEFLVKLRHHWVPPAPAVEQFETFRIH